MYWGHMSVLDADLICLRELRARNKQWQHAATLAGTGEKKYDNWELQSPQDFFREEGAQSCSVYGFPGGPGGGTMNFLTT